MMGGVLVVRWWVGVVPVVGNTIQTLIILVTEKDGRENLVHPEADFFGTL